MVTLTNCPPWIFSSSRYISGITILPDLSILSSVVISRISYHMGGHGLYSFLLSMVLNGSLCHKFIYSLDKRVFGENTMAARTILETANPKTQSVEAVKSLLAYVGRASDPLPSDLSLENGRMVLVLANKKDVYYTCTARACSCPAHNFGHGQRCKHQRRYFPEQIAKPDSIRPACGAFRPVSLLPSEEKAAAGAV